MSVQNMLEEEMMATAHLDAAHRGDIVGAFGTVRQHDSAPRSTWMARLLTLLAIIGPGLIVMVGDNDAGGVATYAQAGQNYGTSLLWVLMLLIPVLIVNQEMVVRLGIVTGVGHARLIIERFGLFWGAFSVGDLFLLNFLTVVTEFIGVSLAHAASGNPVKASLVDGTKSRDADVARVPGHRAAAGCGESHPARHRTLDTHQSRRRWNRRAEMFGFR